MSALVGFQNPHSRPGIRNVVPSKEFIEVSLENVGAKLPRGHMEFLEFYKIKILIRGC